MSSFVIAFVKSISIVAASISAIMAGSAISDAITAPRPQDPQAEFYGLVDSFEWSFLDSVLGQAACKAMAREYIERDNQYDIHHIVPKGHPSALPARKLLEQEKIDSKTEPRNLVLLSKRFHYYLNTNAYCEAINVIFHFVSITSKEEYLRDNYLYTMDIIGGLLSGYDLAINSMLP